MTSVFSWQNSIGLCLASFRTPRPNLPVTYLVAQTVKRLPAVWETQVRSLGWEDLLEKEMATHFSTLSWRIPRMEEPVRLRSTGSQESDTAEQLTLSLVVQ